MVCSTCHGTGKVTYTQRSGYFRAIWEWQQVCPDCGGQRFTHCCSPDECRDHAISEEKEKK
jgi:DnaJ-class molecular chaperone